MSDNQTPDTTTADAPGLADLRDRDGADAGLADLKIMLDARDTNAAIREHITNNPARLRGVLDAVLTYTVPTAGAGYEYFKAIRRCALRERGEMPARGKGAAGRSVPCPHGAFPVLGLMTSDKLRRTTAGGEEKIGATWAEVLGWAHKPDPLSAIIGQREKARQHVLDVKAGLALLALQADAAV